MSIVCLSSEKVWMGPFPGFSNYDSGKFKKHLVQGIIIDMNA